MSRLKNDPINEVPKRVLQLAPFFTLLIIVIGLGFKLQAGYMVIGYWLGLIVNLINFRLIVIGTRNALDKQENGAKSSMMSNLIIRLLLSAGVLVLAVQFGTEAFIAALIGVSMVRFSIQMDGFFTFGVKK